MLDQNTDRMWYVIGAVIVGAALIFLMNGTFPTLFANIGDTFEDKVGETTEMTDGIRPVQRYGPNMVVNGWTEKSVVNTQSTQYYPSGQPTETFIYYTLEDVLKPETTYEFTFDYKTTANIHSVHSFFLGNRPETYRGDPVNTNGEWSKWRYTFTTKDPVADPVETVYTGKNVRFDNNYSKNSEPSTLWVKNVSVREVLGGK